MKHFKPCSSQTAASVFVPHGEVGSRRACFPLCSIFFFLFYISPELRPSSKICLTPSLRQHQSSFQPCPRNIHSPFFSLFFPRCLSFGPLYMDPTRSAWPQGEWHIWAEYQGVQWCRIRFSVEGQTEASHWATAWIVVLKIIIDSYRCIADPTCMCL